MSHKHSRDDLDNLEAQLRMDPAEVEALFRVDPDDLPFPIDPPPDTTAAAAAELGKWARQHDRIRAQAILELRRGSGHSRGRTTREKHESRRRGL